jgi:hypothetical protein
MLKIEEAAPGRATTIESAQQLNSVENSNESLRFAQENLKYSRGFTGVPNIIFDHWLPQLSGSAFKLFMVIWRKTRGWKKDYDTISLRQLKTASGLAKSSITECIRELVSIGLITKTLTYSPDGDNNPSKYGINGDLLKNVSGLKFGQPNPDYGQPSSTIIPEVVRNSDQRGCPKSGYTKETPITKEIHTKEKSGEIETISSFRGIQKKFGAFVTLSDEEYCQLSAKLTKKTVDELIDKINDWIASRGKNPYKDYAAAIRNWARNDKNTENRFQSARDSIGRHTGLSPSNNVSSPNQSRIHDFSKDGA